MEEGKHDITCASESRPAGYCHDDSIGIDKHDWMSKLDGNLHMSELSLPGTHDSMSFYGGDSVQCQSVSLRSQLDSGIRVLDIRCRHIADIFAIHHGVVFQKVYFGEVLDVVTAFLHKNPNETIYMRIKEEYNPDNTTRSFEETFKRAYWEPRPNLFWKPTNNNPTLSETRGKVVVLQNFTSEETFGIKWDSDHFNIQDDYKLNTNWDLYNKWTYVKDFLYAANNSDPSQRKTFINFLSGSTGSFPYFVASGQSSHGTNDPRLLTGRTTPGWKDSWPDFPRIGCFLGICSIAFEGTNILSAGRIGKGKEFDKYVGMVMSDFPGKDLINAIISLN
ncbi:MAG: phosphatidylinositol-specific phospholipase C [Bacteroidales bacterium]|nr:phosphatidylinositol-specific phospholipase C [Bacteroidales bacterium]